MHLTLIAAMAANRVIGDNNTLPRDYPEDLQRFRQLTKHHTIIMGRKTYESIGKPLPQRRNIVLSHQQRDIPGVELYHTTESIIDMVRQSLGQDEVFVIGGEQIYRQFLPYADRIQLTLIHHDVDGDTFFPVFGDEFVAVHRDDRGEYSFITYERG